MFKEGEVMKNNIQNLLKLNNDSIVIVVCLILIFKKYV